MSLTYFLHGRSNYYWYHPCFYIPQALVIIIIIIIIIIVVVVVVVVVTLLDRTTINMNR